MPSKKRGRKLYLIFKCIKTLANELKQSFQVFRAWCSYKYIWIPIKVIFLIRIIVKWSVIFKNKSKKKKELTDIRMHTWSMKSIEFNNSHYPAAIAPETAKPSAADFPRPRAASKARVLRSVLSKIASRNVMTAFPCSKIKSFYVPLTPF